MARFRGAQRRLCGGGLDVFGAEDESVRLAMVASDPAFAEAVIWQNRSAFRTAVAKIAGRGAEAGNRRRQRDGVVAGYWQRYCAKNDTVGFFGPLAWGTIRDDGPAVAVRSRGLVAAREVHFESWCLEALARAIDAPVVVPLNRRPEIELRVQLDALGGEDGLRALDRLEAARAAVAEAAGGEALLAALDAFDACLEELTGAPPAPGEEGAEGGRTPLYLDCMRDLDVDLGPAVVAELAGSLPVLFEASRWWCGRSFAHGRAILAEALADGSADRPLEPLFSLVFDRLWELPRLLAPDLEDLQRRCAALIDAGDDATIAARAAAAFADHGPAWPRSVFHSADVQIAAAELAAIEAGRFLAVVGDFHAGNPLTQGLFSTRFPDPARLRALWHADLGQPVLAPVLRRNPKVRVTSRNTTDITNPDDIHLLGPRITPVHIGYAALQIADLAVRGEEVVDPAGGIRHRRLGYRARPPQTSVLPPRWRGQARLRRLQESGAHPQPAPHARTCSRRQPRSISAVQRNGPAPRRVLARAPRRPLHKRTASRRRRPHSPRPRHRDRRDLTDRRTHRRAACSHVPSLPSAAFRRWGKSRLEGPITRLRCQSRDGERAVPDLARAGRPRRR
ncbi:MAG: lantibiotic dehydratase [Solirubrobacteraceae bacterium]